MVQRAAVARELLIECEGRAYDLVLPCFIDGRPVTVQVDRRGPALRLGTAGAEIEALVLTPLAAKLAARMPVKEPPDLSRYLLSPMPGLLMTLAVEEGQQVKAGEELAVVESAEGPVWAGGEHVGGCTELFDAMREGRLQALFREHGIAWDERVDLDPYSLLPKWLQPRK